MAEFSSRWNFISQDNHNMAKLINTNSLDFNIKLLFIYFGAPNSTHILHVYLCRIVATNNDNFINPFGNTDQNRVRFHCPFLWVYMKFSPENSLGNVLKIFTWENNYFNASVPYLYLRKHMLTLSNRYALKISTHGQKINYLRRSLLISPDLLSF